MSDSAAPAGTGAQVKALAGPVAPYMVELLLATHVAVDGEQLRRSLAETSDEIELRELPDGALSLTYLDHFVKDAEGRDAPMIHVASFVPNMGDRAGREAALAQTWDWPDESSPESSGHAGARIALARSKAVLSILDRPGLPYERRLALFQTLVRALVVQLPVLAIHWTPSARIVEPQRYLVPNAADPIRQGPVNVRLFEVPGGAPGSMIMDTLGLSAFGLRDLQMIAQGPDPSSVARWFYDVAGDVFKGVAKLETRDTIDAVGATWLCRRDGAAVAPARFVIDLRPREEVTLFAGKSGGRCPECSFVPDDRSRWECDCRFMWNMFETRGRCPACSKQHLDTDCPKCTRSSPTGLWYF